MIPGEVILADGRHRTDRSMKVAKLLTLTVSNTGDRPVQVGSPTIIFMKPTTALDVRSRNAARGISTRYTGWHGGAIRTRPGARGAIW